MCVAWLATARAIAGYACGGAGEPCDPLNRPYFRPGANVTRRQIAKIDALAAGITDPIPTTQQTFEDVPGTNPFWVFIEQLGGGRSSAATNAAGRASRAIPATCPTSAPTPTSPAAR